jgi:uncharacterized protein (DUF486 family)
MNKYLIYLLYFLLLAIPASLYTLATFYHLRFHHKPLYFLIGLGIMFAAFEYTFKVPIIRHANKHGITPMQIHIMWLVLTLILVYVFQLFLESSKKHT